MLTQNRTEMGVSDEAKNVIPLKFLRKIKNQKFFPLVNSIQGHTVYRVSQKWRTNGALRCRRDYRKRQKNVKKILLDLFADLAVFESGT
jgi:hypothetical protein